jgi:hypothetical protein
VKSPNSPHVALGPKGRFLTNLIQGGPASGLVPGFHTWASFCLHPPVTSVKDDNTGEKGPSFHRSQCSPCIASWSRMSSLKEEYSILTPVFSSQITIFLSLRRPCWQRATRLNSGLTSSHQLPTRWPNLQRRTGLCIGYLIQQLSGDKDQSLSC